ncbi:Tyrosine recombinase XerD [Anatilimnocola aggregata]|uniref:Tyrosine recombinase XerD n=1 Tax=Anatilimnocola aggregata TaxID=2528021 RepID=A0A517YH79_9BACT|nr:tyrosine-type recombinase/integrase [Anatilimnocola aggregata]QDU29578.1 Tyrosine recombinase XerD [Anatilimnocola aggregata]
MRQPHPWYSETRSQGGWFVKLSGEQHFLGKHPPGAAKPVKRYGRWNPPSEILAEYHKLMSVRDTASKTDYTLDTIIALYVEELELENPALAKRYQQILNKLSLFPYKQKRVGKLLVNAELEAIHLESWAKKYKSDQTRRTYITFCKAVMEWAVKKKNLNVPKNPFAEAKVPKVTSRAIVISEDEHQALLKFFENDCFCDFLTAMWFTGARPGELAKVEARHFNDGLWRLDPSEHKTGRVTGKDRIIGVADDLEKIVHRLSKVNPQGPIFRNSQGRPWKISTLHVRFEKAREKGIIRKEVVPYSYRHAWATHALENGRLDLYEVAKALGHQTTQMVMLHYDHSRKNADHLKDIFQRARRSDQSGRERKNS